MTAPLRLGLVGRGIAHSLSPRLHAHALALADLEGSYAILDCADDAAALDAFAALRRGEWHGLNVTTPFKALALQSADAWARTAQHKAGVFTQPANTLFMQETRLVAASTDGHGLTSALLGAQVDLVDQRVLLVGAGGAGQAVAAELLALGAAQVRVTNRTSEPAVALVARLNTVWPNHALLQPWGDRLGLAGIDVVVHATRLGHGSGDLADALDWLPWDAWATRPPLLVDLVYAPTLTPLQALAQRHGLPIDGRLAEAPVEEARVHPERQAPRGVLQFFGQAMLAHQAARSFQLWTGRRVDAARLLAGIVEEPVG